MKLLHTDYLQLPFYSICCVGLLLFYIHFMFKGNTQSEHMLPKYLFFKVRLQLLYLSLQVVTASPLGLQLMLHHLQPHRCEVVRQVLTACRGEDCKHCSHLGFSFGKLGVFRQVSATCTGVDCKHHPPYHGFVWPEPSVQKSMAI